MAVNPGAPPDRILLDHIRTCIECMLRNVGTSE